MDLSFDPPCTQEYKWRELEEQRQAQKLQKQLQQEQAYLLSLQQNPNLDASKTASLKSLQDHEPGKVNPPQTPGLDTTAAPSTKPGQSFDSEKTRSGQSLEKTKDAALPVKDLQGSTPDSESVREVNLQLHAVNTDRYRNSSSCLCVLTA